MDRRHLITGAFATVMGLNLSNGALAKFKLSDLSKLSSGSKPNVSDSDAQTGLKQILQQGTGAAVTRVSRTNGYWDDPKIRIPLPKTLVKTQSVLKMVGQSALIDDLHMSMNHAAETAAPVAKDLFLDAIRTLTIKDAVGIIKGGDTAGTEYLQKTTTPRLVTAFTPPMQAAMQQSGAVAYFDKAIARNNLSSFMKTDAKTYLADHAVGYALSGLFHYVGTEETAIRHDPAKRTTQILQSLFG
ncbi:MAG: DUF4197 domain-containing protein [Asticcacaulis sp.]